MYNYYKGYNHYMIEQLTDDLNKLVNKEKAEFFPYFFKTGKGQYGEGDQFIGVTVPLQRQVAKKYKDISLKELEELLRSPIHEHRLTALFILVLKAEKTIDAGKKEFYDFYLANTKYINNWDLVDSSAAQIVGGYLYEKDKKILDTLAHSESLWERRIAMIATYYFIRKNLFDDALHIAELLLDDKQDLIHKSVGWMLREIGKRNREVEERFLEKHHKTMPRTMLRYAIEHFDEEKRKKYMKK